MCNFCSMFTTMGPKWRPRSPENVVDEIEYTYDKYASTNPIEQRMMAGFFAAFDRMLDGSEPDLIVEVGAGEGRITERRQRTGPIIARPLAERGEPADDDDDDSIGTVVEFTLPRPTPEVPR